MSITLSSPCHFGVSWLRQCSISKVAVSCERGAGIWRVSKVDSHFRVSFSGHTRPVVKSMPWAFCASLLQSSSFALTTTYPNRSTWRCGTLVPEFRVLVRPKPFWPSPGTLSRNLWHKKRNRQMEICLPTMQEHKFREVAKTTWVLKLQWLQLVIWSQRCAWKMVGETESAARPLYIYIYICIRCIYCIYTHIYIHI